VGIVGNREDITIASGTPKTLSDSGSGADAQTIQAASSLADTGSGADAQIIAAVLALQETGAGADVLSVVQQILVAQPDSGAGSDAVAELIASLLVTDSGSGTDIIASLQAALSLSDSGSGTDLVTALQAALALAESGSGADLYLSCPLRSPFLIRVAVWTRCPSTSRRAGISRSRIRVAALTLILPSTLLSTRSGVDQQTILANIFLGDTNGGLHIHAGWQLERRRDLGEHISWYEGDRLARHRGGHRHHRTRCSLQRLGGECPWDYHDQHGWNSSL
jgi:hypothetical protein